MRLLLATLVLLVLCLGMSADIVQAQAELTLDDCITLALQNRASVLRARGYEAQAAAGKRSALGAFLPQVSASYSYSKGKETNIDPMNMVGEDYVTRLDTTTIGGQTAIDAVTEATSFRLVDEQDIGPSKRWSVGGSLDLINVSNWFSYASARAYHEQSKLDVLASEQDLVYAVKTSYYAYLAVEENVSVQEEAVKRAEEQLKLIQSRFDLGSASLSDVLKQKVQFGNDRLGLLKAKNAVTQQRADLAYVIGLDPRQDHRFSTNYGVRETPGSLDDVIAYGMENNPSLLSGQQAVKQASHGVRAAKAGYLPTLSLNGSWSKFNGTQAYPVSFDYSSNTTSYGFSVNYTIFNGFLREQQLTNAKVAANNSRAELADLRNYTVSQIKTAYLDIEQLKEQKMVSAENVAAAEEDLKITQEKYNLGAATILDLLESQVSLKTAQVQLIQADFDLNLAVAKLENAMGKK